MPFSGIFSVGDSSLLCDEKTDILARVAVSSEFSVS